jgi:hypothetical protein
MIRLGIELGLDFQIRQFDVDEILELKERELQRYVG